MSLFKDCLASSPLRTFPGIPGLGDIPRDLKFLGSLPAPLPPLAAASVSPPPLLSPLCLSFAAIVCSLLSAPHRYVPATFCLS